jgi:hypothetical protein
MQLSDQPTFNAEIVYFVDTNYTTQTCQFSNRCRTTALASLRESGYSHPVVIDADTDVYVAAAAVISYAPAALYREKARAGILQWPGD